MMLNEGTCGREYAVKAIALEPKITHRLKMLGITTGARITILGKRKNGPVIIKVRGSRFAVGKKFAQGIDI